MVESREHGALLTCVPTIDDVLNTHEPALGPDLVAYRNHVYRVVNLCVALAERRSDLEKFAVAAVFHDLGIWTSRTFDYLEPSILLARDYLGTRGRRDWIDDVERMIADHHKITPVIADHDPLVEVFRRADWVDVTRGLRAFGVPRRFIALLYATWPGAGFHRRLVQLAVGRFRTHPLSPLPMVKL